MKSGISDAIGELKKLLKTAIASGASYSDFVKFAPPGCSENTIKQFVFRSSKKPRKTVLVESLLRNIGEIKKFVDANNFFAEDNENEFSKVDNIHHYINGAIGGKVSEKFRSMRKRISINYLPKTLYYVRKKIDGSLIRIIIEIFESKESYFFTMKISGSKNRIVVGDISEAATNVYFSGISYHVSATAGIEDFYRMNYFTDNEVNKYISQNPIGLEFIVFKRLDIENEIYGAFFTGIDGKGDPIIGAAAIFNGDAIQEKQMENIIENIEDDSCSKLFYERFSDLELYTKKWMRTNN